jgi:hypothetical protein
MALRLSQREATSPVKNVDLVSDADADTTVVDVSPTDQSEGTPLINSKKSTGAYSNEDTDLECGSEYTDDEEEEEGGVSFKVIALGGVTVAAAAAAIYFREDIFRVKAEEPAATPGLNGGEKQPDAVDGAATAAVVGVATDGTDSVVRDPAVGEATELTTEPDDVVKGAAPPTVEMRASGSGETEDELAGPPVRASMGQRLRDSRIVGLGAASLRKSREYTINAVNGAINHSGKIAAVGVAGAGAYAAVTKGDVTGAAKLLADKGLLLAENGDIVGRVVTGTAGLIPAAGVALSKVRGSRAAAKADTTEPTITDVTTDVKEPVIDAPVAAAAGPTWKKRVLDSTVGAGIGAGAYYGGITLAGAAAGPVAAGAAAGAAALGAVAPLAPAALRTVKRKLSSSDSKPAPTPAVAFGDEIEPVTEEAKTVVVKHNGKMTLAKMGNIVVKGAKYTSYGLVLTGLGAAGQALFEQPSSMVSTSCGSSIAPEDTSYVARGGQMYSFATCKAGVLIDGTLQVAAKDLKLVQGSVEFGWEQGGKLLSDASAQVGTWYNFLTTSEIQNLEAVVNDLKVAKDQAEKVADEAVVTRDAAQKVFDEAVSAAEKAEGELAQASTASEQAQATLQQASQALEAAAQDSPDFTTLQQAQAKAAAESESAAASLESAGSAFAEKNAAVEIASKAKDAAVTASAEANAEAAAAQGKYFEAEAALAAEQAKAA